jgi:hypothetical protein
MGSVTGLANLYLPFTAAPVAPPPPATGPFHFVDADAGTLIRPLGPTGGLAPANRVDPDAGTLLIMTR